MFALGCFLACPAWLLCMELAAGADASIGQKLPNAFFALNFERLDAKITTSQEAQSQLLRDLGYDGMSYLGPLEGLAETMRAVKNAGLDLYTVAVIPYDVSVDPGGSCPPVIKSAIKQLKNYPSLVILQYTSAAYGRSSSSGDDRAVELGRELADFASGYGVRLAIYPHSGLWCERVDHAVRLAKHCEKKNLGVCFNLIHWLRTDPHGNLKSRIEEAMPYLFLVTINGLGMNGTIQTLDRSDYDVFEFLKPFIAAGYRGPIGLQCVGIEGDARDNLTRSMNAWRTISAKLMKDRKVP